MSSVPALPISPSNRRRSLRLSSFEVLSEASPSPYTSGTTSGTTFSRRSSRTSQTSFPQSPTTPRLASARPSRPSSFYHHRKSSSCLSIGSNISFEAIDGGLGNLADELEDALEDEYEMNGSGFLEGPREGSAEPIGYFAQSPHDRHDIEDTTNDPRPRSPILIHEPLQSPTQQSITNSKSGRRKSRHQRRESKYHRYEHGSESDQEQDGITPALAKRMNDVESLARMRINTEDTLSEGGGVIKRTTAALKDLGPQTSIEANVSRIISAYTSMTSHRTHKTREIFSLAHSLLYGNVTQLPEESFDVLLSQMDILSSTVTFSQQQDPLASLQILASQTLDLAQTLRSLTDALQESRIQSNAATRKLKSARDMVEDICTEQELIETSMMLIQAGDWDRRCRDRQAAATCREVVLGFGDRWGLEVDDRPWTRERKSVVS